MDDFNIHSLQESRNEWTSRLVTILVPCIFNGIKSIFNDAIKLTTQENQPEKYLMTFQNLLIQIPKWNNDIIENEVSRIMKQSNCDYIEVLITCVHIVQLKALTCIRVGQSEKNVDINIPKLTDFIHRVYINSARSIYTNIYLFENDILPLQIQQNYNKVDNLIKESIIESIRQSMPIDEILRSYLEDTIVNNVNKKTTNENIPNNLVEKSDEVINNDTINSNLNFQQDLNNQINILPENDLFPVTQTLDNAGGDQNDGVSEQTDSNILLSDSLNGDVLDDTTIIENNKPSVSFSDFDVPNDSIKISNDDVDIKMDVEELISNPDINSNNESEDLSTLLGVEILN